MKLYTIRDDKAEAFNNPFCARTDDEAMRMIGATIKQGGSLIADYPEDFTLYYLFEFDSETGGISGLYGNLPVSIINLRVLRARITAAEAKLQRDLFEDGRENVENGKPYDSEDQCYSDDGGTDYPNPTYE